MRAARHGARLPGQHARAHGGGGRIPGNIADRVDDLPAAQGAVSSRLAGIHAAQQLGIDPGGHIDHVACNHRGRERRGLRRAV